MARSLLLPSVALTAFFLAGCGSPSAGHRQQAQQGRSDGGAEAGGPAGDPDLGEDPGGDPSEQPTEDASPSGDDAGGGAADGGKTACTWIPGAHARSDAPHGWRDVAPIETAGIAPRSGPSVWTGNELFVWGGSATGIAGSSATYLDGATYDPSTDTWKKLPDTSFTSGLRPDMVYGDGKVLIWGGHENVNDGVLFDLCTGTWEPIPAAPIVGRVLDVAAWSTTTHEMVVWGGVRSSAAKSGSIGTMRDGAAYSPATHTWRTIAPSVLGATDYSGVWTGTKLTMAFGGGNHGGGSNQQAATYDPATDLWTMLSTPPATARQHTAVAANGTTATFFGGYNVCHCTDPALLDPKDGASYDEGTTAWTHVAAVPASFGIAATGRDQIATWWAGGKLHFWSSFTVNGGTYDAASETWSPLEDGGPGTPHSYSPRAVSLGGADELVFATSAMKAYRE